MTPPRASNQVPLWQQRNCVLTILTAGSITAIQARVIANTVNAADQAIFKMMEKDDE